MTLLPRGRLINRGPVLQRSDLSPTTKAFSMTATVIAILVQAFNIRTLIKTPRRAAVPECCPGRLVLRPLTAPPATFGRGVIARSCDEGRLSSLGRCHRMTGRLHRGRLIVRRWAVATGWLIGMIVTSCFGKSCGVGPRMSFSLCWGGILKLCKLTWASPRRIWRIH